ncbi:MAG: hypothetical protein IIY44_03795 [Erysipelotrichales bacterium]|nr:hypothetical protein [Erysipelotrichales bacterium]MBQ1385555.1 hypothetical protein [Erysipelotrichales bacterium]MBQ2310790.1 hypothetical protein [Erysipelotrichales bacterium]MBQ2479110.1 hypothetical protein [Erysipelotrichales bacterium]MBQ4375048.1 hypothetical protein [Erysipelotrichales bacterium]
MEQLHDDELMIISEDGKEMRMRILFTTDFGEKNVVFFTDYKGETGDVGVMYYDEKGNLTPLEEEDYTWAEEVLEIWKEGNEGSDD